METKRAVLYARVSGDDRKYATSSIEGQLAECRAFAAKRGYTVVDEKFEDPDKHTSGADWLPELENLLQLAANQTFDVLICREMDRLARGLAKQLVVEGEFTRSGVEIAYVLGDYPDTPEGALMKNIRAVIAEYEKYKITERMVRGRRQRAKAGHVVLHGGPPYGYQQVEADGKTTLAPVETEAAIVRLIFEWYIGDERMSTRAIAKRLTDMGIVTAADSSTARYKGQKKKRPIGTWGISSIAAILSNTTYIGVWHYSKSANDPEKLIPVQVPAIVTPEEFGLAQLRKKENQDKAKRNVKHDYLLRRRVFCASCGYSMQACFTPSKHKRIFYYKCRAAHDRTHYARMCSQTKHFRVDQVDTLVWEWVKSYLTDPAKMAEGLTAYQSESEKENAPLRDRLTVLDKLIADNKVQLDRLLDLYLSGDFPKDALFERKTRLTDILIALERERKGLMAQLATQSLTENEIQSLVDFAKEVSKGLEKADHDFDTRRSIIEILDLQVTLSE